MQLLKFKVIEWEAAQDQLDEQMQQTEAATDLQELVDELQQQKAELDRMCNELIEQQLTQEEKKSSTLLLQSLHGEIAICREPNKKLDCFMGQTIKSSSLPTPPRKNPTKYAATRLIQEAEVNNQAD